jgi:hypothetical protein
MLKYLRQFFRRSPHLHVRQRGPQNLKELVALLDRFLDGRLEYELEWDDFISWNNSNPNIESIRDRIAAAEPLFFSKRESDRRQAVDLLLDERNRTAVLAGIAARTFEWPRVGLNP